MPISIKYKPVHHTIHIITLTQLSTLHDTNMENDPLNLTTIISKQIFSDSTNTQSKNSANNTSIETDRRSEQQSSLALATFYRYKEAAERKYRLEKLKVESKALKYVQETDQDSSDEDKQQQILKRALYNARQTPLIPLIADLDFLSLSELSDQQDSLLAHIFSLINNNDEECSFYEQFQI